METILLGKKCMVEKLKLVRKTSILISLAVCSCEIIDHRTDILVLNKVIILTKTSHTPKFT